MVEIKKVKNRVPPISDAGLTLIEVIFAIILFAGAMITLLALQSSNLSRTFNDRNKIRAMLAAREILSAIEIQEEPLDPGSKDGSIEDIFDGLVPKPPKSDDAISAHNGLSARLEVENFALPEIGETALQKITVWIFWGLGSFDFFKTTFFTPGKLLNAPEEQEES